MYPALMAEKLIHRFRYWADGTIQIGMHQGRDLYRQVASFPLLQRQQAYQLGLDLAQQGQAVVLTHAYHSYVVWVALRSTVSTQPPQAALLPLGQRFCSTLPALN